MGHFLVRKVFKGDNYSRETTIQGRKLLIIRTFLVQQVFKGDNHLREEAIRGTTAIIPTFYRFYLQFPLNYPVLKTVEQSSLK